VEVVREEKKGLEFAREGGKELAPGIFRPLEDKSLVWGGARPASHASNGTGRERGKERGSFPRAAEP